MSKQNKPEWSKYIKSMSKICGKDVLPDVRMPYVRKKETKPRKEYDRSEDKFRGEVIKYLRSRGFKVWRVEPQFRGKFGLGDLWVMHPYLRYSGWVEVKSINGVLSDDQKDFQNYCRICNVNYLVVKKLEDLDPIFKANNYL